jgi:hypothetical protein
MIMFEGRSNVTYLKLKDQLKGKSNTISIMKRRKYQKPTCSNILDLFNKGVIK